MTEAAADQRPKELFVKIHLVDPSKRHTILRKFAIPEPLPLRELKIKLADLYHATYDVAIRTKPNVELLYHDEGDWVLFVDEDEWALAKRVHLAAVEAHKANPRFAASQSLVLRLEMNSKSRNRSPFVDVPPPVRMPQAVVMPQQMRPQQMRPQQMPQQQMPQMIYPGQMMASQMMPGQMMASQMAMPGQMMMPGQQGMQQQPAPQGGQPAPAPNVPAQLAALAQMGFTDENRNRGLIKQYNGDMNRIVGVLSGQQ